MIYDDDDGQVDGDSSGRVDFTPNTAQPWLRSGMPPWHLWGNTQRIQTVVETLPTQQFRQGNTGQLLKIAYKRPETWHWVLYAKLLAGPDNTPTFFSTIFVNWELVVGVGRSIVPMVGGGLSQFGRSFERFTFQWGPTNGSFPAGREIWTSAALTPNREFNTDPPFEAETGTIDQIVAQDIQLSCRVSALTILANVAAVGQPVEVEVSAAFAPKSHVRPDWYRRAPPELAFPGDEIEGR
jgi:hypothetical protein